MKHRFQRYTICTEIFSTFHARVEYISAHSNECTHTDRQTKVKTEYLPVSFRSLGGYKK